MAVTNKQQRAWIRELISIKAQMDAHSLRRHEIAAKLGVGTWRSSEFPYIFIQVKPGANGWRTNWKAVAKTLAKKLGVDVNSYVFGNRTRAHRNPSVSVNRDSASTANPKLKRA